MVPLKLLSPCICLSLLQRSLLCSLLLPLLLLPHLHICFTELCQEGQLVLLIHARKRCPNL